jgi:hypothetical protein
MATPFGTVKESGTATAQMLSVIEVSTRRGAGTEDDPVRTVRRYFADDGTFLAEHDHHHDEQRTFGRVETYEGQYKRAMTLLRELRSIAKPPYSEIPSSRLMAVYDKITEHIGE